MDETLALGREVAQKLAIKDIVLRCSNVQVREGCSTIGTDFGKMSSQSFQAPADVDDFEISRTPKNAEAEEKTKSHLYSFHYRIGVRLVPDEEHENSDDEDYEPPIQIMATFEARYVAPGELVAEELDAFAKTHVGFNVWPFWREFVQSTCLKLGMNSTINVPLYRMPTFDDSAALKQVQPEEDAEQE